jgi:hypothetical protein
VSARLQVINLKIAKNSARQRVELFRPSVAALPGKGFKICIKVCVVGWVTSLCYGLDDPRLLSNVIFYLFRKHPNWLWGSSNLVFNGWKLMVSLWHAYAGTEGRWNPALVGDGWPAAYHGRFSLGKDPVLIVYDAEWASGPVWLAREIWSLSGFDPWTVQFIASCYTAYFPGVKRPGREIGHSPPYNARNKNKWSCTSSPICVFGMDGNNFIFSLVGNITVSRESCWLRATSWMGLVRV